MAGWILGGGGTHSPREQSTLCPAVPAELRANPGPGLVPWTGRFVVSHSLLTFYLFFFVARKEQCVSRSHQNLPGFGLLICEREVSFIRLSCRNLAAGCARRVCRTWPGRQTQQGATGAATGAGLQSGWPPPHPQTCGRCPLPFRQHPLCVLWASAATEDLQEG